MRVEELDAAVRDTQRTGRELAIIDQIQQVVGNLLLSQLIGRRAVVARQIANLTQVTILSSLRHTSQLQVPKHPLTQSRNKHLLRIKHVKSPVGLN